MAESRLPRGSDIGLLFVSLLVAFLIWLIGKQGATETMTLTTPIRLINPDPICALRCEPGETLVQLQFPTSLRPYITPESFFIEIDGSRARQFAGIREQTREHLLTIHDIKPAADLSPQIKAAVTPLAIAGDRVAVLTASFHNAPVRLDVRWTGAPPAGYELAHDLAADEDDIKNLRLVGQPERLEALQAGAEFIRLTTREIDLKDPEIQGRAYASIIIPADCFLADVELGGFLDNTSARVLVDIPLVEERIDREIVGVPIEIRPLSTNVKLDYTPRETTVTVHGVRSAVETLDILSFRVTPLGAFNETPEFKGNVPIGAQFTRSIPEIVRAGAQIVSVNPEVALITVISLEPAPETAPAPDPTPSPPRSPTPWKVF